MSESAAGPVFLSAKNGIDRLALLRIQFSTRVARHAGAIAKLARYHCFNGGDKILADGVNRHINADLLLDIAQGGEVARPECLARADKQLRHYVVQPGNNPRTACQQVRNLIFVITGQYREIIAYRARRLDHAAGMRLTVDGIFNAGEVREFAGEGCDQLRR